MANKQRPKIILFDKKEIGVQSGKQYLVILDKAGETHKINEKRQSLWGLFNDARENEAYLLIYETYNNIEYVADARKVADELLQLGIQEMAGKLADQQTGERLRSQSISYAKDLTVAGRIDNIEHMFDMADKIFKYIKNGEGTNKVKLEV